MSLVAGFRCRDGFIVAADTEITHGNVLFQGRKLADYFGDSSYYSVVVGCAGDVSYSAMTSQKIRDAVAELPQPTISSIKMTVEKVVAEVYADHVDNYWTPDDEHSPVFDLVLGVEDQNRDIAIVRVDRTSVSEVEHCAFVGSGTQLAEHLVEKLWMPGMSVATTSHLVLQLFREIKQKGAYVGGNTEIIARLAPKHGVRKTEPFFDVSEKDYRFLWGLEDILMSAIRDALDRTKSPILLDERLTLLSNCLRNLRKDAEKERVQDSDDERGASQRSITEFGTEYGNWYKDF